LRAALISLAGQPRDARGEPLRIAGKTLARRQLEFALAAGCERIVALGDGALPEAIALAHLAERGGARFRAIRDSQGLLAAVRADDALVVLAPGLLPDSSAAPGWLEGPAILVAPADAAVAAGFERIDLERAWAGALVLPGNLVERLAELAPDSEPAPALLRIALQAKVKQVPMPAGILTDGAWSMARSDDSGPLERQWLARNLPVTSRWSLSGSAAQALVKPLELHRRASDGSPLAITAATSVLLAAAAAIALLGWGPVGFGVLAVAVVSAACVDILGALNVAPFGKHGASQARWLPIAVDAALVACGAGAIAGEWPDRLFAPLVLVGLLRTVRWPSGAPATALLGDRAVLAALLAVAAAFGMAKPAIMLAALLLIGLQLADSRAPRG